MEIKENEGKKTLSQPHPSSIGGDKAEVSLSIELTILAYF